MERATHPARAVVTIPRTSSNRLTSRRGRQTRSSVGFGLAHDVGPEPEYAGAASVASGAASDRNSVNPGGAGTVRHAADPGLARMPRGRKTSLIPPGATAPESMIGSFTDRRVSNRDSAGVRHRERSGPPSESAVRMAVLKWMRAPPRSTAPSCTMVQIHGGYAQGRAGLFSDRCSSRAVHGTCLRRCDRRVGTHNKVNGTFVTR